MRIAPTPLSGVLITEPERHADERGFFSRTWCADEFAAFGVYDTFPQANVSHNDRRGTLRGLHVAVAPAIESKLVMCSVGAIFDVVVDLRPDSPTHLQWFDTELGRANGRGLYIPAGLAHGFLTLEADTDVTYLMGDRYRAECQRGVRWNDPRFEVAWPFEPSVISERDAAYPDVGATGLMG